MSDPVQQLHEHGQSVWLDYIRRDLITSGELGELIAKGWITGMTSNPTIFQKAISSGDAYADQLRQLSGRGLSGYDAFVRIGGEDIRLAADALRPVYDATQARDGFVSFEAQAAGAEAMEAEARQMWAAVDRPNLMIKIPGLPQAPAAVEELIAAGINVNITLLFDVDAYEKFAWAYIQGLERRVAAGLPIERMASVASFFVSRVDTKVDAKLPEGSPLRGKVAIANALKAYALFQAITSSERWQRLAQAGARVQRPLWASTGTKNPAYSDVLYVEELVARDTVNTLPEATLNDMAQHGVVRDAILENIGSAEATLVAAAQAGIDLKAITAELLEEGVAAFDKDFATLLSEVEAKTTGEGIATAHDSLNGLTEPVNQALASLVQDDVVRRLWQNDYTLWSDDPTEITQPNRLGWLSIAEQMQPEVDDLRRFAAEVHAAGYTDAVLLGMGGSSLAPQVFFDTFGRGEGGLKLSVLDTTVPAEIIALEQRLDLAKTLFIVASKSGTTLETTSHLAHFWERTGGRGEQFIAITDPGTPLEKTGRERGFRRVFLAPPSIGGRYSALSFFGLVPATLIGVDIATLLQRAVDFTRACDKTHPAADNPGARLGAIIGTAASRGQDKLTLVLPNRYAALGAWLEQLLAESTGKLGRGVIPIDAEALGPPESYGADRLFVAYEDDARLQPLAAAGHPVVRLLLDEPLDIGAEFVRWEVATAVAGHFLYINPFDQPNVQQAKDATAAILAGNGASADAGRGTPWSDMRRQVRSGDYVAIQAYLPRDGAIQARLDDVRRRLRDRLSVATTLGYGPRYLHSTGQVHKGGPNSGVFIQVVDEVQHDLDIPGREFSFGRLMRAQADGDLASLAQQGRRTVRLSLKELEEATK